MTDSKEQFEKAFSEWAAAHPAVNEALTGLISTSVLRDVAGYFYHTGQGDAIRDARTVLADAFVTVKGK